MWNLEPVSIVEILGRAEQGMTKPFKCKDANGQLYYVKGRNADRRSLIAEWVCGHLAQAFGLPLADFAVVDVPNMLLEAATESDWAELGSGQAFGSKALPHVLEITWPQVAKVPQRLRQDVLVFDWWIRNDDRNLTEYGGNPNLLWNTVDDSLVVIDHNLAFSENFNSAEFFATHVFRDDWNSIFDDCVMRAEYATRLQQAFAAFEQACHNCPPEWFWVGEGVPAKFDRDEIRNILLRFEDLHFWEVAQ